MPRRTKEIEQAMPVSTLWFHPYDCSHEKDGMCFLNLYRIHVYYSSFTKILCFMFTTHFVCILENRIGERA
ncbi:hypothetical protein M6B38_228880 [Iris pallida]|uniref:Uncharacterized protein n=1 Tax=Iris pallida TaxID=29817 RepID=A0AAX6DT86_IRIPA|nr:hypothetical protein M6B38_228880 [Iris pallida]